MNLNYDCLFFIINKIDNIDVLKSFSQINKIIYNYCKKHPLYNIIKYKVNYKDPNNFIYKINNVKIGTVSDLEILELYMKYYNETSITCYNIGITSYLDTGNDRILWWK